MTHFVSSIVGEHMDDNDLNLAFHSLNLGVVQFKVIFDGVFRHISRERIRVLDRIVRFQPYGYTTTGEYLETSPK